VSGRSGWIAGIVCAAILGGSGCRVEPGVDPRYAELEVRFRGHREVRQTGPGEWEPLVAEGASIGPCVTAPPLVDTSRWQVRWTLDGGAPSAYVTPVKRLESTLCFEAPLPPGLAPGAHRLCPELRDDADGAAARLVCLPFHLPAQPERLAKLTETLGTAYAARTSLAHDTYIARLESVSRDALNAGFPLLALRAQLMAVHALRGRGTSDDWKKVDRILARKPDFLAAPASLRMAGEFDLADGIARCDRNLELRTAWERLSDAGLELERSLSESWPVPRVRQADLIAAAGSPGDARLRLVELSEECRRYGCEPGMLNTVLGTHAWLTLLDYDASEADLAKAQAELTDAIEHGSPKDDAVALANRWVNLAFARVRSGSDARPALEKVRTLLAGEDTGGSGRAGLYAAWARIIGGLDALRRGASQEALEACGPPPHVAHWPQLAAQALSCRARAHHRMGDRALARREIDRALAIHAELSAASIGQAISLGPGQRAEDFFFAAGLAIEEERPEAAWQTLADLDTLSGLEADRARCRNNSGEDREREREGEQARLDATLEALSGPAPLDRIAQREGVAQTLRTRLQDLIRLRDLCDEAPLAPAGPLDARAFAFDDAVVSLWSAREGGAIRVQRTDLPRLERIRRLDALESAARQGIAPEAWDALASPFAAALVPAGRDASRPVRIALYGSMQRVPLAALPAAPGENAVLRQAQGGALRQAQGGALRQAQGGALRQAQGGALRRAQGGAVRQAQGEALRQAQRGGGTHDGSPGAPRWGARTPIVVVPSQVGGEPAAESAAGAPLFIVDPAQNLAAGAALASLYRDLFPKGTVLEGKRATRGAVAEALRGPAMWIHFDGHGRFDPAFGELSSIHLADGEMRAEELAAAGAAAGDAAGTAAGGAQITAGARALVNLSGCQTGRSHVSADAGRFGPARALLRHGVLWVVASRTDLPDDVALAFNTAFYGSLHGGAAPEEAFREAISVMARTKPPSAWAGLILLGHPPRAGSAEPSP